MAAPTPALRVSPERPAALDAHTLTRRALLDRGGSLAGALGLASLGSLPAAPAALAADPLRKCVSLGGPQPLRVDAHPNDYRHWGNREYLRDASRTNWVHLWVSWEDLQQEFEPATWQSSWRHLNTAPFGRSYLRRLDGQMRAANDDGLGVMVGL